MNLQSVYFPNDLGGERSPTAPAPNPWFYGWSLAHTSAAGGSPALTELDINLLLDRQAKKTEHPTANAPQRQDCVSEEPQMGNPATA